MMMIWAWIVGSRRVKRHLCRFWIMYVRKLVRKSSQSFLVFPVTCCSDFVATSLCDFISIWVVHLLQTSYLIGVTCCRWRQLGRWLQLAVNHRLVCHFLSELCWTLPPMSIWRSEYTHRLLISMNVWVYGMSLSFNVCTSVYQQGHASHAWGYCTSTMSSSSTRLQRSVSHHYSTHGQSN